MKDIFSVNIAIERVLMTLIVSLFMEQLDTNVQVEFQNFGYNRTTECIVKNPTHNYRIRFQVVINGKLVNLPKMHDSRLTDFENKYILARIALDKRGQQYLIISVDNCPFPLYFTCVVTMNRIVYLGNGTLPVVAFPKVSLTKFNETVFKCDITRFYVTFVLCDIGGSYNVMGSVNAPSHFTSGEVYLYRNIWFIDPFLFLTYVYLNFTINCFCDSKLNIQPILFNTSVDFVLPLKNSQILILKPQFQRLRKGIWCLLNYNSPATITWFCGFCVNPSNDSYEKHVCDNMQISENWIKFNLLCHDTFAFNCTCSAIISDFYPQFTSRIMPVPFTYFVVSYNNLPSIWRTRFTLIMIMWWLTLIILFLAITLHQFNRYFYEVLCYEIFVLFGVYQKRKIPINRTFKEFALVGEIEFFNILFVRLKLDVKKSKEEQKLKQKEKPNPFANKVLTKTQSGKIELNEKAYSLFRSKKSRLSEGLQSQEELENELIEKDQEILLRAENEPVYKNIFSKVNLRKMFSSRHTKEDLEPVKEEKVSVSLERLSTASDGEKFVVYRDIVTRISIRPGKYDLSTSEIKESSRSQSITSRRRTQTATSVRDLLVTFSKPVSSLKKKINTMSESRISRMQKESKYFASPTNIMNLMKR